MEPMTDSPRRQRGTREVPSIPLPPRRLLWLPLTVLAGLLCLLFIPGAVSKSALAQTPSEVEYSVTFEGMWNLQSTPGGVVSGAHFTTLIGAVHNSDVTYWQSGGMATAGVEGVAELGSTGTFRSEINASGNNKLSIIERSGTGAVGTRDFNINVTSDYPLVTLLSMIGPSPDWFVGISGLSLVDGAGEWREQLVVNLYPYDAGTEEGTEFSLSNPATSPQETISSIRGMGKFSNQPMARLTFTLKTPPPVIGVSQSELEFYAAMVGDVPVSIPTSQKLQVWNTRRGPMRFNVSDNADWLSLDPTYGSSGGPNDIKEIDMSIDTSDLEAGYHRATIEISGSGIENSPQRVPVVLRIGATSYSSSTLYAGASTSTSGSDPSILLVIPQDSVARGTTIIVARLEVLPEGAPSNVASKVMWSVNVKAYPAESDVPYMDYSPSGVKLGLGMPSDDQPACSEDRAKLYSVTDGSWELVEHSCGIYWDRTYAVSSLMSVSTLALVVEMDYDANGDGRIDRDEVIRAISDYFDGLIDRDRVLRLIQRYFSDQES